MTLYRIEAPHFVAGLLTRRNTVVMAAPILTWTIGSRIAWIATLCAVKQWKLEQVPKL